MIFNHIVHQTTSKFESIWVAHSIQDHLFLPCCIEAVGQSEWQSGEKYERAQEHTYFGWEFIEEGIVEIETSQGVVSASTDMCYFLFPAIAHRYQAVVPTKKRFLAFCGTHALAATLLFKLGSPEEPLALRVPVWTRSWFAELDAMVSGSTVQPIDLSTHWHRMLCALAALASSPKKIEIPDLWHPAVEKAIAYIQTHLDIRFSRAEVAQAADISEPHISRLFTEEIGVSIMVYVENQRLNLAQRLLHVSNLSISEIARRIGYDDPLYFSTRFKKRYGASPLNHRKNPTS